MRIKTAKGLATLALCLAILMGSLIAPPARAAVNVLLIHGRNNPAKTTPPEHFGVWATDQMNAWGGNILLTSGHVYYVQWDAWGEHFDSTTASPAGGWLWVNYAVNRFCNANNGDSCYIVCHSAGCAAFENYLAKSDYNSNPLLFHYVLAGESAAGGSELAEVAMLGAAFGVPGTAKIDESLTPGFARGEYNHNNMQGVLVRGSGGTSNDSFGIEAAVACIMPGQFAIDGSCSVCAATLRTSCSDGAVGLHSSCGHNRAASFLDCNGNVPGVGPKDSAGTYDYHSWWIGDDGYSGPYSPMGKSDWDSSKHTYRVNHSAGKKLVIDEYSRAPVDLAP
jgi:hypothetical protein